MQLENIDAMASDAVTGEPIRGAKIVFATMGGRTLGTAYTDYDGIAAIAAPENLGPGTLQELLGPVWSCALMWSRPGGSGPLG
jgi:hypothetical protein